MHLDRLNGLNGKQADSLLIEKPRMLLHLLDGNTRGRVLLKQLIHQVLGLYREVLRVAQIHLQDIVVENLLQLFLVLDLLRGSKGSLSSQKFVYQHAQAPEV